MTLRRIGVLIAVLPADSALMSAIAPHVTPQESDKPPRQWTTDQHLLATIIDAINYQSWVTAAANSKRPPKKPQPIERPSYKQPEPRRLTTSERAEIQRRNHGN